jgi:hypothetical protein
VEDDVINLLFFLFLILSYINQITKANTNPPNILPRIIPQFLSHLPYLFARLLNLKLEEPYDIYYIYII